MLVFTASALYSIQVAGPRCPPAGPGRDRARDLGPRVRGAHRAGGRHRQPPALDHHRLPVHRCGIHPVGPGPGLPRRSCVAQILWGLGATFQSGATEAWIADELQGHEVGKTYLRGSQLGYAAAALGIGSSALLGSLFGLAVPMVVGGIGFLVIAATLVAFMPEDHYTPEPRGDRSGRGRWATP